MYGVTSQALAALEMGYAMSRLEIDSDLRNSVNAQYNVDECQAPKRSSQFLDHEIAQLTKLRSTAHKRLSKDAPGKCESHVSTVSWQAKKAMALSLLLDSWGSDISVYDVDRGWKLQKHILAKSLRWTVTDTSLSPDQQYLVYVSMSPIVHIVDVRSTVTESLANVTEIHDGLDFSAGDEVGYIFGIFSVKFSTDGRELVAGSSDDSIYVYDLQANKLSLRIMAHMSNVNTVCFADESGHLILSGSDDNFCKVWDRRCFNARGRRPAAMQDLRIMNGTTDGWTILQRLKI